MPEEFIEIARTDAYPLMAAFENQLHCPRIGKCDIVRQHGLQQCCDSGDYCSERNKEETRQ